MMKIVKMPKLSLIFLLITLILNSCSMTAGDPVNDQVWIDVPLNGIVFELGQAVNLEGHAANPRKDLQVEIWINGTQSDTIALSPLNGNLSYFTYSYLPPAPGDYVIQAVLIGVADEPTPTDTVRISVGGTVEDTIETIPSPTLTMTPELTLTPTEVITLTPTPQYTVEFWADPLPVPAGGCTTIYWQAENVSKVIFGGVEQPFTGSYEICDICETQNYRLVITYMNGNEETLWLEITVTGSCATPTPTPTESDLTPPPIPAPNNPANGLNLSCRSSQSLTWEPVSDLSGIAEYQVEVQRSSDNSTWSNAAGSPMTGIQDKTTTTSTDCGWYYRWRVRAIDGAGNASNWSTWSYFSITLI